MSLRSWCPVSARLWQIWELLWSSVFVSFLDVGVIVQYLLFLLLTQFLLEHRASVGFVGQDVEIRGGEILLEKAR